VKEKHRRREKRKNCMWIKFIYLESKREKKVKNNKMKTEMIRGRNLGVVSGDGYVERRGKKNSRVIFFSTFHLG
jgi:hypothetical protein